MIGPPFSPTRPAAEPAPGSRTCPRIAAPPAGPELALPELRAVGGLAPTFGCERLCCSPSPPPTVGSSGLCLIPPPLRILPFTSSLAEVAGSRYSASLSALFSRGGAETFLPGDTGWWAWCSPHCGLYGSLRRTKGVHSALLSRSHTLQ